MCNKADQKLSELSCISAFIDLNKRQVLFQSIINLQFSYCPLIRFFCSRKSSNLINKIQESSLRIVISDKNRYDEDLLKSNNQSTVYQRNLPVLITEVFKITNGLSPPIMDIFLYFVKMLIIFEIFK